MVAGVVRGCGGGGEWLRGWEVVLRGRGGVSGGGGVKGMGLGG